jgi:hypothetical protein
LPQFSWQKWRSLQKIALSQTKAIAFLTFNQPEDGDRGFIKENIELSFGKLI